MKYLISILALLVGCGCELQSKTISKDISQPFISEPKAETLETRRILNITEKRLTALEETVNKVNSFEVTLARYNKILSKYSELLDRNPNKKRVSQALKSRQEKQAIPYTGAVVYLSENCPYCDRLIADLNQSKRSGWKIGSGPNNHFVISPDKPKSGGTPQIIYYRNGNEILVIEGYSGNITEILANHPKVKRSNNPPQFKYPKRRFKRKQPVRYSTLQRVGFT